MKSLKDIKNLGDKDKISEAKDKLPDPPQVLLLKRKAIRLYPSGKRVALYHNDKLGIDISIPYSPNQIGKEVAGVSEQTLDEAEHDDLFGDYSEALKKHMKTGTTHTDHPELSKLKAMVINKYGKVAHGHLHAAAEHMLDGNVPKAARRYAKFENTIDEDFKEVVDQESLDEGVVHRLHHIVQTKTGGTVSFKNGSTAHVEYPQAAHIMKLHTTVNPQNKATIEKLVNQSPVGLSKVAEFASQNLK